MSNREISTHGVERDGVERDVVIIMCFEKQRLKHEWGRP